MRTKTIYEKVDAFNHQNMTTGVITYKVPNTYIRVKLNLQLRVPSKLIRLMNNIVMNMNGKWFLKRNWDPRNIVYIQLREGDIAGAERNAVLLGMILTTTEIEESEVAHAAD